MSGEADAPQGSSAYERLLNDIKRGVLLPGTRLRETELSARLGISRTPVREAIRRLEADGLIIHEPRQGATVRSLSYAEMIELYEIRAVLEGTAARLAARAALTIEVDELSALNDELAAAASDPNAAFVLNRQFHRTLADAARNRFLIKTMSTLQKTMLILGQTTLADAQRHAGAVQEHTAVITALRAGDGEAAERAMRLHVEAGLAIRIREARGREIPLDEGD